MDLPSLASMLFERPGAKIAQITAVTTSKLSKGKQCPFYGCSKESEINTVLNWIYQNAVNARREKEGKEPDFEPQPRPWGERVFLNKDGKKVLTPFVKHIKDGQKKIYLEARVMKSESKYFQNGEEIPIEKIKPYIIERSAPKQGLDEIIVPSDYQTINLRTITFAGQTHELNITPEQEEEFYDTVSK